MKNLAIKLIVLLIVLISLVGCALDKNIHEDNTLQDEIIIKSSYEKPLSLKDENTIILNGLMEGDEYIEVTVNGEILDFEHVSVVWDENKNDLEEKETVKKIEKLKDQTLVIKTYQPEGIPSEKIKWKSRTGKSYEYIIQERSLGDTDNNVLKINLD
ncbi:hypothetical protein [Brassicibacter mesophilus]|uniref:hypothetical protein n=1 Tax=Brassicibacter mesophilus TaxID=745119 RepID=UPI003D212721